MLDEEQTDSRQTSYHRQGRVASEAAHETSQIAVRQMRGFVALIIPNVYWAPPELFWMRWLESIGSGGGHTKVPVLDQCHGLAV